MAETNTGKNLAGAGDQQLVAAVRPVHAVPARSDHDIRVQAEQALPGTDNALDQADRVDLCADDPLLAVARGELHLLPQQPRVRRLGAEHAAAGDGLARHPHGAGPQQQLPGRRCRTCSRRRGWARPATSPRSTAPPATRASTSRCSGSAWSKDLPRAADGVDDHRPARSRLGTKHRRTPGQPSGAGFIRGALTGRQLPLCRAVGCDRRRRAYGQSGTQQGRRRGAAGGHRLRGRRADRQRAGASARARASRPSRSTCRQRAGRRRAAGAAPEPPIAALLASRRPRPRRGADRRRRAASPATASTRAARPASARTSTAWSARRTATWRAIAYSAALKCKQGPWTFDELNEWLKKPSAYAPGTKMSYAGLRRPEEAGRHHRLPAHACRPTREPLPAGARQRRAANPATAGARRRPRRRRAAAAQRSRSTTRLAVGRPEGRAGRHA